MRVNRFVLAIGLCAGLGMSAGLAHAGTPSDLLDGGFDIISSQEPNTNGCTLVAASTTFFVQGGVDGQDGKDTITIQYFTPQPTSVSRKTQTAKVKEGTWSQLTFRRNGTIIGSNIVDKCSVSGSVNTKKGNGSVKVKCKSDDVFTALSVSDAQSVEAAFANSKTVKVKLNTNKGKGSISIKCKGDLD